LTSRDNIFTKLAMFSPYPIPLRNIFRCFLMVSLCLLPLTLQAQETVEAPAATSSQSEEALPAGAPEAVSSPANPLLEKLRGSGKTGIALFLISVIGFSFAFERIVNLRRTHICPQGLAAEADARWKAGDIGGLKKLASERNSTLGRVILAIVDHRNASHADISAIAGDVASREMRHHLLRAYPLAVVATISPLLGLFGTVYGMIGAFESVALAGEMGDPSIMAGDISYALITTALGLVIAVPALAVYHFLRIRTRLLSLSLEEQSSHLISRWFGPEAAGQTKAGES